MTQSCFPLLVLAALAFSLQQEATPPTPSVADAARAARERQKASTSKRVVTDDDVVHSEGAGSGASGIDESQIRAELDKAMPTNPIPAQLQLAIFQISEVAKASATAITARVRRTPVGSNPNADFPGKKEWETQIENAINHMVEEAGKTVPRLQALQSQSQEAFSGQNPEALKKLRSQWIDAEVSYVAWQKRAYQLSVDGSERAKAAAVQAQPQ